MGLHGSAPHTVADEIQHFLTGVRRPVVSDRVLATVLFTDIVVRFEQSQGRAWECPTKCVGVSTGGRITGPRGMSRAIATASPVVWELAYLPSACVVPLIALFPGVIHSISSVKSTCRSHRARHPAAVANLVQPFGERLHDTALFERVFGSK